MSATSGASTFGTGDFERALGYTALAHAGHLRKGTRIPYLSHLLAVASLVMEDGGDETEAIAALLHDVVEDQGGAPRLAEVREEFGERVAAIVAGCSDTEETPKPPWRERKRRYIAHLASAEPSVLRVSLADKVHNARAILLDYRIEGEELWRRFDPDSDQLWYYRSLANAFSAASGSSLVGELNRTVTALEDTALTGALRKLTSYRASGDYAGKFLIAEIDDSRNYYIQFAVDEGGLLCEVVNNTYLAPVDVFSERDIAKLLALGFEWCDLNDEDRALFHISQPESDEDYAEIVALVRTVITEYLGLPREQPLQIGRSWWPKDEDASPSNLPYYADEQGIAEEARARPHGIANLSEQEQMAEYRRRIDRYWLRDAAQLPELEGETLRFVWDIVVPPDDLNTNTISIDNRVIWREPAVSTNADRVDAVKELLMERYGERFKGLAQTDRRRDHA